MDLGFVFKASLYGLTVLVGAILGAAEGEGAIAGSGRSALVLPFLSLPIVVFGYLYTERRRQKEGAGGRGISSTWANVLGIIALIATGYEFTSENREGKLLAGTHLLLYATWIVLFQLKTVRLYWFLMALGILQLAVASVLTTKGWFGFCALGYMFGAVWTLSIFSLWRAEQNFEQDERTRLKEIEARRDEPQFSQKRSAAPQFTSEVRSSVQHEDGARWLTPRFVTGVLMTSCSALVVSAAFFAFIPRVWVGAAVSLSDDSTPLPGTGRKSSLSNTVRLGDLGTILESSERVFEIQLSNVSTRRPVSAQDYAEQLGLAEPLFRATILTHYDQGEWRVDPLNSPFNKPFELPYKPLEMKQVVRLEPSTSNVLFCMGQPVLMADSKQKPFGELNESTGVALLGERKREGSVLEYTVHSSIPKSQPMHHKFEVSPHVREAYERSQYLLRNTRVPSSLKDLRGLTREVLDREADRRQKAEVRTTPRKLTALEMATALEAYLRDSGEFRYTLDQSIQDPKIDPVEDFLLNRKAGHCEYFASALVLMLRAAKIPARMVSGYKGGIPHPTKKDTLEVQQRFAHVWVEAWVDRDGWTTLDATPINARSLSVASFSAKKTSIWTDVQTTLSGLWSENVLNMSLDRQEESIYRPMRELAMSVLSFFQQLFTSPAEAIKTLLDLLTNREQWISPGGGLFAFGLLLILAGLGLSLRWAFLRFSRWSKLRAHRKHDDKYRVVEFYERFAKLMQTHGIKRSPTQTQREFTEMVASAYSPELSMKNLTKTPDRISQLFYQVRFGEVDLSDTDAKQIETLLIDLERALAIPK